MRALLFIVLIAFAIASDRPDFPESGVRHEPERTPESSFGFLAMMGMICVVVWFVVSKCGLESRRIPNIWKRANMLKRMKEDSRRRKNLEKSEDEEEGEVYEKVFDRETDEDYEDEGESDDEEDTGSEDAEESPGQLYPEYYNERERLQGVHNAIRSRRTTSPRTPNSSPVKEGDVHRPVTRSMTRHDDE
jgi:hypothetical protein